MTNKQKNALDRILKREQKFRSTSGLHPSLDKWTITDNSVAVLFYNKPEEFDEASRNDTPATYIAKQMETADFVLTSTPIDIPAWKAETKGYQRKVLTSKKTIQAPILHIELHAEDGRTYEGNYNEQFVLDAVEAIGSKALIYIATKTEKPHMGPSILIMHADWMEDSTLPIAIVLPIIGVRST